MMMVFTFEGKNSDFKDWLDFLLWDEEVMDFWRWELGK